MRGLEKLNPHFSPEPVERARGKRLSSCYYHAEVLWMLKQERTERSVE